MGGSVEDEIKDEKNPKPLDEDDIALLKTYVCIHLLTNPKFICFDLSILLN